MLLSSSSVLLGVVTIAVFHCMERGVSVGKRTPAEIAS